MAMTYMRHVAILATLTVFLNLCEAENFATWTFDRRNGTMIIPEHQATRNFYADASVLGTNTDILFPPGKIGDSLFVDGKELILAKNLNQSCIFDLDICKSGLSITFYLKIISWNNASAPIILRTSSGNNSTGLYIAKSNDGRLVFHMVGSSGEQKSREFPLHLNGWARYKFVVFHHRFGDDIPKQTTESANESPLNFVVGSENGATFYLDELSVDYSTSTSQNSVTEPSSTNKARENSGSTIATETSSNLHTQYSTMSANILHSSPVVSTKSSTASPNEQFNIWIPIVLGILACAVGLCIILILCSRRQCRRNDANLNDPNEIAVEYSARRNGSYLRTSIIENYHQLSSISEADNAENDVP